MKSHCQVPPLAHMVVYLVLLLLLAPQAAGGKSPDRLAILGLLKEQKYEELQRLLAGYQASCKQGAISDEMVERAFYSFANSDPALRPLLDEWAADSPSLYVPYVARGYYETNLGWLARGGGVASKMTDDQEQGMDTHFTAAAADFQRALALQRKLTVAYSRLMEISMAWSKRDVTKRLVDEALAIDPRSWSVRRQYLSALQPKWRGSLEAMEAFIDEMRPYYDSAPSLRALEGFVPFTQADMTVLGDEDRTGATAYYTQAIEQGEFWFFYVARGRNYYFLGQLDDAIADFTHALALHPHLRSALEYRGSAFYYKEHYARALKDLDRAIELDALDPGPLTIRGNIWFMQQRLEDALRDYQNAVIYGGRDDRLWSRIGTIQASQFKDYESAAHSFKTAISINPKKPRYWQNYFVAQLFRMGSWFN